MLTEGWIRRAADMAVGTATGPGDIAVQYAAETGATRLEHFQVFEGGRLAVWELGRLPEAAFTVVQTPEDQVRFLTGRLVDVDGQSRTWIEEPAPDGSVRRLRPPPLDERDADWSPLPEIPGASIRNGVHLTGSPWRTVSYTGEFRDGKRVAWEPGVTQAETTVTMRYPLRMQALEGLLTVPEMIEGGEVTGDWSKLMVLAGIDESPEYQVAIRSGSGVRLQMATFAEAVSVLSFHQVQAELARAVPTG
jgi:hypothetical protein